MGEVLTSILTITDRMGRYHSYTNYRKVQTRNGYLCGVTFNIGVEILTAFDWVDFLTLISDTMAMGYHLEILHCNVKRDTGEAPNRHSPGL